MSTLLERDAKYVWHPFTQHQTASTPLPVERASGSLLYLADGSTLIDAISSWWTSLFGHGKPEIIDAIRKQAEELDHVIYAGCTHSPAVDTAEKLIQLSKFQNGKVFFSDNGSTAVEVALKATTQYWQNVGQPERREFITFANAYHGDTIGAMSAGDPGDFGRPFKDLLFQTHRAELPLIHDPEEEIERKREALRKLFRHLGNRLAGIIIEPMVQGAGGMQMTSAKTLSEVISLTHEHGGLVIADEVMTGFGRTGKLFGHQHQDEKPDILCVAKGLTGGTLPLAATIFRDGLFEAFLDPKKERAFLHGHSFTANPIACAAARASLSLMCEEPFQNDLARIQSHTSKLLENLRGHKNLAEARQLGTIGALKMAGDGGYFAGPKVDLPGLAKDHGVLLRPLGNIVYTMPPLSTSNEQLEMIYGVIETCLDKWS